MTDNDVENALMANTSLDELIKQKISQEISQELIKAKKSLKTTKIGKFADLIPDSIFAPETIYKLFNRLTKQESFINGSQLESLIGINNELRAKLLNKLSDCVLIDDYFVKFDHAMKKEA